MSYFSELSIDIMDAIEEGALSFDQIAKKFGVTIDDVNMIWEDLCEGYSDDSMDGDAESALASAGFGTDEDYGYYGE